MLLAHWSGDGALLKVPQAQPLWRGSCDHSIPVLAPSMLLHKVGPSFFSLKGRGGTWRPCPSLTLGTESSVCGFLGQIHPQRIPCPILGGTRAGLIPCCCH